MDETEEGKVPRLAGMDVRIMVLFFCCALLACNEGRRRGEVSEISEKTDLPTFQDIANQLSNNVNKTINGVVPVRCRYVMGVSRYHRRRVHWYGYSTQSTL